MSEKGPFDAAINELHGVISEAKEVGGWQGLIAEYETAIRVLEAAGKIDKSGCLKHLEEHGIWNSCINKSVNIDERTITTTSINHSAQIRSLIESLPDTERGAK